MLFSPVLCSAVENIGGPVVEDGNMGRAESQRGGNF